MSYFLYCTKCYRVLAYTITDNPIFEGNNVKITQGIKTIIQEEIGLGYECKCGCKTQIIDKANEQIQRYIEEHKFVKIKNLLRRKNESKQN